jgi:hypothetical protein
VRTLFLTAIAASILSAQETGPGYPIDWWAPGQGGTFPPSLELENPSGRHAIRSISGPLDTKGHPFFEPLGTNGRACITCHQPAAAMSITPAMVKERWRRTAGKDPIFAAIDGSNCPGLPQDKESSHSLLINRGLFRVGIKWPPPNAEFTIEVVRDFAGCNNDPTWGLKSPNPTVSIYRRPRVAANLRYVMYGDAPLNPKTGEPTDTDPDTGRHVAMNLMTDARAATLKLQAIDAALGHMQAKAAPTDEQLRRIIDFESGLYLAQASNPDAGRFDGPELLEHGEPGLAAAVFGIFDKWKDDPDEFRASVARGADIFANRAFWIRDTANFNNTGIGNPIKGTCASCHKAHLTGMDVAAGFIDLGTGNYPNWTEPGLYSESGVLPVFKITCSKTAPPHPFLGRTVYTTDPGRALISGKCADIGSLVMPQLRGLAARAPFFANGSATTIGDVVDFYDTRFDIKMSRQEKLDLINFLSTL